MEEVIYNWVPSNRQGKLITSSFFLRPLLREAKTQRRKYNQSSIFFRSFFQTFAGIKFKYRESLFIGVFNNFIKPFKFIQSKSKNHKIKDNLIIYSKITYKSFLLNLLQNFF